MPDRRLAVVDLGSNSFRMVVFAWGDQVGNPPGLGWWRRTDEIFETVRIGAGVDAAGALSEDAMDRALAAIGVFAHFARASGLGPDEQAWVATSAIREATNRDAFLARARDVTGTDIRVLSRKEEARYGHLAAVNSTTLADGVVLDLGGGSMQLVRVAGRHAVDLRSWALGAVRMTERFGDDLDELATHAAAELAEAPWVTGAQRLVGIGGTVRTLAAAAQRAHDLPSLGVQGMAIDRATLDDLIERLAALAPEERASVPGIKAARGEIVLAGAVVIRAAIEACGVDALEVTEAGLREGVFLERMLGGEDPPLVADVRMAGVLNLAARHGVDPVHTRHVAALACGMFDQLAAAGLHDGDPHERELLWAASVLHDVGVAVDYDDHHRHSRYLILNGGLPGFTPRELAIVAQAARYHRKGMPGFGELSPLVGKRDGAILDRCAVLLRLAEDLERSRDQTVRAVAVQRDGDRVRMRLETGGAEADGSVRVAVWAASRERELFERAFGAELEVLAP